MKCLSTFIQFFSIMKRKKNLRKLKRLLKVINNYFVKWQNLNKQTKEQMKKIFAIIAFIVSCVIITGCNATRTITTTQTHIKGQDTITTMTTRTTESYDASIKPKNLY